MHHLASLGGDSLVDLGASELGGRGGRGGVPAGESAREEGYGNARHVVKGLRVCMVDRKTMCFTFSYLLQAGILCG